MPGVRGEIQLENSFVIGNEASLDDGKSVDNLRNLELDWEEEVNGHEEGREVASTTWRGRTTAIEVIRTFNSLPLRLVQQ